MTDETFKQQGQVLPLRDSLLLVLFAVIWGLNGVLTKIALNDAPPLFLSVLRFSITLVVLIPFIRPIRQMWKPMLAVCVLTGPLHFGLQYFGIKIAHDFSPMVIAMQLWIPASVAFAAIFLKEQAAPMRLFGMAISFGGIIVLVFEPSVLVQLEAFILVGLASLAYGGASVIMRRYGGLDPIQAQAWLAIVTIPALGLVSIFTEQGQLQTLTTAPPLFWFCVLFAALISGLVANVGMWRMVQRYEMSRTTPFSLLTPIVSIVLGVIILGDPVSPQLFVGGILALFGVAIVALAK